MPEQCAWCDYPLDEQRWIALWPPPKLEVHCCSGGCLDMWLRVNRSLRLDTPTIAKPLVAHKPL